MSTIADHGNGRSTLRCAAALCTFGTLAREPVAVQPIPLLLGHMAVRPSNSPPAQRGSDPSTRRPWTPAAAAGHVPYTSRARAGHGPRVITRDPNTSRAISSWARSIVRAEPECGIHSNTLGQNGPDYHYYRPGPGLEGLQSLTRRPPTQAAQSGQSGPEGCLP